MTYMIYGLGGKEDEAEERRGQNVLPERKLGPNPLLYRAPALYWKKVKSAKKPNDMCSPCAGKSVQPRIPGWQLYSILLPYS